MSNERRNSYRLEVYASISHTVVNECPPIEQSLSGQTKQGYLCFLENQAKSLLQNIINPEIHEYLLLNEKRLQTMRELMYAECSELELTQKINISESGIAFAADSQYEIGNVLKLEIFFPDDYVYINSYAEIINLTSHERYKSWICCRFIEMPANTERLLSKYIIEYQMQQRPSTI